MCSRRLAPGSLVLSHTSRGSLAAMTSRARGREALPGVGALQGAILGALRNGGGSATVLDMLEHATREFGLSADQLAIVHDERRGKRSEVSYRMAWARTELRSRGLIEKVSHGCWVLTEKGRSL